MMHILYMSRSTSPQRPGIALARRPRTYPLQTGSHSQWTINLSFIGHSASPSSVQGSRVPGRLLYRHSRPTSFTVSHSTSPDHTTLPAQYFRSSGLLCRWSDSLEVGTRYRTVSVTRRSAATAPDNRWKRIYFVAMSTHSAVEMLHDSALYKSTIDIDKTLTLTRKRDEERGHAPTQS